MSERPDMDFMRSPFHEDVNQYCIGGYHPVEIGDVFNNRYLVVNMLAYASCSMVWLVEDLRLKRFASLKILSAKRSAKSSEKHVVHHLKAQQEHFDTHPGKEHVMQVFDAFTLVGPNGTHLCIVAELLGFSLAKEEEALVDLDCGKHFLPQAVYTKVAGQVALGLAYLHKCGIIHGDLHLGNILFYSPDLQKASRTERENVWQTSTMFNPIQRWLSCPSLHPPSEKCDHQGGELTTFRTLLLTIRQSSRKICDFGEFTIYERRTLAIPAKFNMPHLFKAPEVIFNDISAPTSSMDIWSLGVVLYMIMRRKLAPFHMRSHPDDGVVESMVIYLGKLPEKWWRQWTERAQYFDESGVHFKYGKAGEGWSKKWLSSRVAPSEEEAAPFSNTLWKIFRYNPEERIDAEEVVRLIPDSWKHGGRT